MYLQIIEKFPDDAGAYLNIARILLQYRRFDDAREFVEKALRIAPYFKQAQELKMRCNKMV
jgi:tetratricopeptide (TPR) repeat protein